MENIVVFGFGYEGWLCYCKLNRCAEFNMLGFADNAVYKQGCFVFGHPIRSMEQLSIFHQEKDISVIIASTAWAEIGIELEKRKIPIKAVWERGHLKKYTSPMTFDRLDLGKKIKLYAGDICDDFHYVDPELYGLSINCWDSKNIRHDITQPYPLPDNCVDSYEAEDVLEHIEYGKMEKVINEIYRILKKGGLFRISVPDFWNPAGKEVVMRDVDGNILWDPSGGGKFGENGVECGGHLWYPTYSVMNDLLQSTKFKKIEFLCYHKEDGELVMNNIDFSKGHLSRIEDSTTGIGSIVIDCYK